ncbi:MAG: leucine-rich repeat protein, partial [Clostridia bacterium]|nr:leucine-rich repeat protein [Clostridia bacterium]
MSKTTKLALLTVCIVIALSCVLVACSPTKYTLTFNTVGGEMQGETTVLFKEGAKIEPGTPQKGNFVFEGWYADAAYSQKFESFGNMPAEDVTVYAKWSTYTSGRINFVSNGGSPVDPVRGVTGQPVEAPANPTKDGYKFVGWCQDETLINLYTFSTYPNGEITLYAKWQQSSSQFAYVTFDLNGVKTEVAVQKGQPVQMPESVDGQSCVWYADESKLVVYNFDSEIIANTTLYGDLCTDGLVIKGNTVTAYNGTATRICIPQSNSGVYVTTIASNVFAGNNDVSSVVLPTTVQTIGDHAFYNCEYLENINLNSNVKNIGSFAFSGCKRLSCEIDLTGLTAVSDNLFANCRMVDTIKFGDSLQSVGAYAFADCKALAQISLPNSVETIGEYAFANTAITTFAIPDALTTFGQGSVKGCKIDSVTVANNTTFTANDNSLYANEGKTLLLQFGTVETLTLPSTVETINPWAFDGAKVTNLDVSALTETALQKGSLRGIVGLQSLKVATFNSENKFLAYWFGANAATDNTTQSLLVPTTLTSVEFAVAQTIVPDYAFYGCYSVQTITGFESVTEIGTYAYAHTGISNIVLSAQTTNVHSSAFAGANN